MGMATIESIGSVVGEPAAGEGPLRTCVVTRRELPPADLIRFVAAPDGAVVPDVACRLPGRGVWVSLDREAVAKAVATRAFNRGLKREVTAPADLPLVVERLLQERARAALSIANKAGQVLAGFSKVDGAILAGTALGLVHACDASADGIEKLDRRFTAMCRDLDRPPKIVRCFTIEQMSLALGRLNVVHAALMVGGAAQGFLVEAERLERYRTGQNPGKQAGNRDENQPVDQAGQQTAKQDAG
jgi:predicted RNA-binding protein YlxR (DUF448 family)